MIRCTLVLCNMNLLKIEVYQNFKLPPRYAASQWENFDILGD